ncbi:hypothetical protein KJ359_001352 [Pestalotiopsis sp. 9143b]|nr:hypothetical protein KJ359_001352 [Pestalotiopsis sp. 9143b]
MDGPSHVNRAKGSPIPELRLENGPLPDGTPNIRSRRSGTPRQLDHHRVPLGPPWRGLGARGQYKQSVEQQLNLRLRKELPCYVGTEKQIAQPHILRKILAADYVLALLNEYKANHSIPENEDVEAMCRKVRGDEQHPSCIVMLATLILVDKGSIIGQVLRDRVFDKNLPLRYSDPVIPEPYLWDQETQQWRYVECLDGVGIQTTIDICKWQWYLNVPYMKVEGPSFRAFEKKFAKEVVLPWSSKSKGGTSLKDERTEGYGGYSAVYRYHIDQRFHGFQEILEKIGLSENNGFFALKVVNLYHPEDKAMIRNLFYNEREQLSRFNGVVHKHLVTLLAAFEQEDIDKNYFIFPWAECDLSEYWERRKQARDVKWVSEQLLGLVGALDKIHNPTNLQGVYGRHGDLKPDNILWYTPHNGDKRGILVISDMGFTAVNSEMDYYEKTNGMAHTPSYRAPELDIHGANVTREYDIWCLGCIFLEMLTWLLGGDGLIKEFKTKRMTLENGTNTPIFFTFDKRNQAVVKDEVTDEEI